MPAASNQSVRINVLNRMHWTSEMWKRDGNSTSKIINDFFLLSETHNNDNNNDDVRY